MVLLSMDAGAGKPVVRVLDTGQRKNKVIIFSILHVMW